MSTAAVMQLFDNDTSHVQLYLTLGMLLYWMAHICFHRNRDEISVWFMWLDLMIRPFLDYEAVQLWGRQRALTLCVTTERQQQTEWCSMTFLGLPLYFSGSLHLHCAYVNLCTRGAVPKPWGSNLAAWLLSSTSHCQTTPPLPALFIPTSHTTCSHTPSWVGALPPSFYLTPLQGAAAIMMY